MMKLKYSLGAILILATALSPLAQAGVNWAEAQYYRLTSPELTVRLSEAGHAVLGVSITQKNNAMGNFCRKYQAVAPYAVPSFSCFTAAFSGNYAKAAYEEGTSPELDAMFFRNNSPLVGERWTERQIVAPRIYSGRLLCVKTAPVVPHPIANYTCYTNLPQVGGGVSVGN